MYQFDENLNHDRIFPFDKKWIENMNWATLPKSSKAVLPVILAHCNGKGLAFPGEQRIAILSGRTEKQARQGINGLTGFPGFKWQNYTTKRGKRGKRFFMRPVQKGNGRTFPFRTMIIYGGNWSQLRPSAQAVYPVLRYFSFFDIYDYFIEIEEDEPDETAEDFNEVFANRDFDFCNANYSKLAEYAGIARRSVTAAMNSLVDGCLLESATEHEWKVYVRPPKRFRPSYLNSQIKKRYRVEKITGNGRKKLPKNGKKLSGC